MANDSKPSMSLLSTSTVSNDVTAENRKTVDSGVDSTLLHLKDWLFIIYVIIGVFGIIGNSIVGLVLLRFNKMRQRLTNIFVINQSMIDFATSLFLLLLTVFQDQSLPPGLAGEIKCRIWLAKVPFWASYISSSMNLVAITLERYMKIVHPITHRNSFTERRAILAAVFIWLFGYVYNVAIATPLSAVHEGVCLTMAFYPSVAAKKIDAITHFLLQYFLPVTAFTVCYSKMALVLRRRLSKTSTFPVTGSDGQPYTAHRQQQPHQNQDQVSRKGFSNIIKTMLIVSLAFVVCLSTNQWLFLFYNMGLLDNDIFVNPVFNVSILLMYVNCCINPIIYAASYQHFREAFKRLLPRHKVETTPIVGGLRSPHPDNVPTDKISNSRSMKTMEQRLTSQSPLPVSSGLSDRAETTSHHFRCPADCPIALKPQVVSKAHATVLDRNGNRTRPQTFV